MMRDLVFRFLKVPPQPQVPGGSGRVRTFRAAENFFTYQQLKWIVAQFAALIGLLVTTRLLEVAERDSDVLQIFRFFEIIAWIGFVVQIPFTYIVRRLDYEMRWYIVTDRSLRIREGVTKVREKTMTFANIQNMTVRQGPIQRLLKIADLEVRTAGGGAVRAKKGKESPFREDLHLGYFRGVDNAAEIRDLIRARVREHRDSGLGDPDEPAVTPRAAARTKSDPAAAARELLEEVQRLRAAFANLYPR